MALALLLLAPRPAREGQHGRSFVRDAAASPVKSDALLYRAHA
jgi:hypothetical protein